jgi:lysophospholipase L1-like esterase
VGARGALMGMCCMARTVGRRRLSRYLFGTAMLAGVLAQAPSHTTDLGFAASRAGRPGDGSATLPPVGAAVPVAGRGMAVPTVTAEIAPTGPGVDDLPVYLALGDSIAFGFDPFVDPASARFVGYPAQVATALSRTLVEAGCPGETSAGFVSAVGVDNGCRGYRAAHRLHATYPGTQLDFAVEFLRSHPSTNLVTLGIGINDVLRCTRVTADACAHELGPTLEAYRADLTTILQGLRAVYDGELVLVDYYSPDYRNSRLTGAIRRLDTAMTEVGRAYRARAADAFAAFADATGAPGGDICAAGLLIPAPHGCDVHPSTRGRDLLAVTVTRTVQAARAREATSRAVPYGES